jgi:hypothetical protein
VLRVEQRGGDAVEVVVARVDPPCLSIRQILIVRSSAAEMMSGRVGRNVTWLTPRSWPSRTHLTAEFKISRVTTFRGAFA